MHTKTHKNKTKKKKKAQGVEWQSTRGQQVINHSAFHSAAIPQSSSPPFVLLWDPLILPGLVLKAPFTKIKDRKKHPAQLRVGARMFS